MSFISMRGIIREYGLAQALRGVDCALEKGEWVSIVGPSGSGKSTLLNIMGGLDRASRGSVSIGGRDINALSGDKPGAVQARVDRIYFSTAPFDPLSERNREHYACPVFSQHARPQRGGAGA